ncbi:MULTISPECIES: Clp protease N-terminal domain-containing protein [unclassified Streptomyces]|uniref:Clp protease N-terminal domain-containing protein n=1 Tax=unclassified Streptomyces TaxID=2593676 RepID=UPI002DD9F2ED|nr:MULTISPECIES: Clp protease N-terminal domain-containing protein [unclassified Streptomyces]WSA96560.1 peptidase [Streptomyces sp. NBC_01795]WSB80975.1 peptidase [Streptomyces sp. NBC_01775]
MIDTARRRAARDGDRQIDTAHLLHSLLESDSGIWELLDGGSPQVGKLLGYLVQRSIGYGLRWQSRVEDSGSLPAVSEQPGGAPGWSPSATAALELAVGRARRRGRAYAEGVDLFAGVVADEECRGVEVLHRAGVDTGSLAVRLGVASHPAPGGQG